uniref:Uncharacterized protein n=1 Tax=Anguilla anguilla TaxID=7936 RepID=A0A0E9U985_ANGAN
MRKKDYQKVHDSRCGIWSLLQLSFNMRTKDNQPFSPLFNRNALMSSAIPNNPVGHRRSLAVDEQEYL